MEQTHYKKPLNQRIFDLLIIIALSISLILEFIYLVIIDPGVELRITTTICVLFYLSSYLLSKKYAYNTLLITFFSIFTILIISVSWFYFGGVQSGIGFYYVVISANILIITPSKYRLHAAIFSVLNLTLIYFLDYSYPELVKSYLKIDFKVSQFINLSFSCFILGFFVYLTKNEFYSPKEKTIES